MSEREIFLSLLPIVYYLLPSHCSDVEYVLGSTWFTVIAPLAHFAHLKGKEVTW